MLTVLAVLVVGCRAPEPALEPLRFAVYPTEAVDVALARNKPLMDFLSKEIGREITMNVVIDITAVIEAMKSGRADFCQIGPFSYVIATQVADVEAIVALTFKHTGEPFYHSAFIARTDSHITDLNGKSFGFVDPASTSGYLVPLTYLTQEGIELGERYFAGSHPGVVYAVKNGSADVGALALNRFHVAIQEGAIEEGELEVLWTSEPIPGTVIAIQSSMDPALKEQIRQAFLAVPVEIAEEMGINTLGFAEASDSDYDVIRAIQDTLGLGK